MIEVFLHKIAPYAVAFLSAFALTFLLVPLVTRLNNRLGMVDKPDPRRINKLPVPRGGGVAASTRCRFRAAAALRLSPG